MTGDATKTAGGSRRGRRVVAWWSLAVVVALVLGVVLGRWAFAPPAVSDAATEPATVEVVEMTVGQSLPLAVSASWSAAPFGVGAAAGTLTSLDVSDGDAVSVGQTLYSVDLRPVVAGQGTVPAFRDLAQGSMGGDVAQLQRFLAHLGYFPEGADDGRFGAQTSAAVREWQRNLGVARDGVLRAGDIVFADALPVRVQVVDDVRVGTRLIAGDVVLHSLGASPEFVATVPSTVSFDSSAPIYVAFQNEEADVVVVGTRNDDGGNSIYTLARPDGSSICADACSSVSLDPQEAVYPARLVQVAEVTGPGVPAAAVSFHADGSAFLLRADGVRLPVTIVGQGQGRVVLDGVAAGTTVRLPDAGQAVAPEQTPSASSS